MQKHSSLALNALWAIMATLLLGGLVLGQPFPGAAAQQSNFVGGEPAREDITDARISRLRFAAGSRSNWHYHDGGQMLMIIEGRAVTQVRGQGLREMHPGEPWYTPAGVEHWHGAHPQEDAYQLTISIGETRWLEPVTDAQYLATPSRP
ncbi:MAG: hypothetical protein RLZZ385_1180 [Pseudomonadota bacterium]|jgi:quercetin dioxygenase-like cupin family protein